MNSPQPTRAATESEDQYTQIYIHGEFHAYLPKFSKLKEYAGQMKRNGYVQTGFTIGGPYMKVNFNRSGKFHA